MSKCVNSKQISHITIRGYKSIKGPITVEFQKLNILIGSNGSGKSNFISIFKLLQNVLNENLALFANLTGVNAMFYKGRKVTEEIGIEVYFGDNSYGFVLVPTDDNRIIFKKEYFGYSGTFVNESNVSRGHSESMWRSGTDNKISQYVVPILESQNWRVYHFHDTGASAKVKQEQSLSNNKTLQFDASNLAAFLYRLTNHYKRNYDEIVDTIRLIAPYFDDFDLEPNDGNGEFITLRWRQKGCDDTFSASQFSDGTLRFICLATLLLQPEELQPETIIIDEPELGLHPYAITIFSELAKQISGEKQIIISTQSVELLNEFDADDVIVVNRKDEASEFKRLHTHELKDWLDSDYSLGELWNKNILGGRLSK